MNELFIKLLKSIAIKKEEIPAIQFELENFYHTTIKAGAEQEEILNGQLAEVNKKIDAAEESRLLKEVTQEVYAKFITRYQAEREKILEQLGKCVNRISNLSECTQNVLSLFTKLFKVWK